MESRKNEAELNSTRPLIGFSLSKKKLSKLRFEQFLSICRESGIETVELTDDYFRRSSNRIPNLIIHKLEENQNLSNLIDDIRSLPSNETIVVDRFQSIGKLLDRFEQYSLLDRFENLYKVPNFIRVENDETEKTIVERIHSSSVAFPLLCKPIRAHGDKSHRMKIIFDAQHLIDIEKPCVLQQFVDHDAVLFKVFAVGTNNFQIVQRSSIRNMKDYPSNETISFHSSEVSSAQADHVLSSPLLTNLFTVDQILVEKIVENIQNLFQLNLIGIDIIVNRQTAQYSVIDVNYFPGYEGVQDFSKQLFRLCEKLLNKK